MSKNINHFTSNHVKEVQYSDFIVLDSNDNKMKVQQIDDKKKLKNFDNLKRCETTGKRIFDLNDENNVYDNTEKIHMRFLNREEVNNKLRTNLILKSGFCNTLNTRRTKGRALDTMDKINTWIIKN